MKFTNILDTVAVIVSFILIAIATSGAQPQIIKHIANMITFFRIFWIT